MKKFSRSTFYCFSPAVMLITFIVEFVAAFFVLFTAKKRGVTYLIVFILFLLGTFQLSEYAICESLGLNADVWGRIAFIAITVLPPAGLHLAYTLAGKTIKWPVWIAYGTAFSWIVLFSTNDIVQNQVCTENYLIFNMKENFGGAYFIYYYVWLLLGAFVAYIFARASENKYQRYALYWFIAGYASFVIPATFIWGLSTTAAQGLPSIMCGFALTLAVILTIRVSPLSDKSVTKIDQQK